jgi:hypothetical protein
MTDTNRRPSGKIDVDVAKIAFQPLARVVSQRDECLAVIASMLANVAPNLIVASGVAILVTQAPKDLHGGVTLLGRRVLVVGQHPVDNSVQRPEHRRGPRLGAGVRLGL